MSRRKQLKPRHVDAEDDIVAPENSTMDASDEGDRAVPDNLADSSCMFLTDEADGVDCSDECGDEQMDRDYDVDDSDNDDDDVDQMMDISSEDPSSAVRLMSFLHPMGVMPFVGRPGGDNNVKLASLGSTDVAVAQFAENNILPSDLAMLNMVLWNLQQQQLFQMHLLQQLQSQLMYASSQACGPPCPMLPTGGFGGLPPGGPRPPSGYPSPPENHHHPNPVTCSGVDHLATSAVAAAAAAAAAAVCSSAEPPIPASATLSNSSAEKTVSDSMAGSTFPVGHSSSSFGEKPASEAGCSGGGLVSSCSSSIPNSSSFISPMLAMIDMSSSKLLQQKILQDNKPVTSSNSSSCNSSSTSSSQNWSRTDDPFFKHKCRYCQKGFSSDSALQIHIRSHTGERPYKCSICGNRFSTKGNLKVHFMCHTDKYPHIRMDQNTVFESHQHSRHHGSSRDSPLPVLTSATALPPLPRENFHSHPNKPPPLLIPINQIMSSSVVPDRPITDNKLPAGMNLYQSPLRQDSVLHTPTDKPKFTPQIVQLGPSRAPLPWQQESQNETKPKISPVSPMTNENSLPPPPPPLPSLPPPLSESSSSEQKFGLPGGDKPSESQTSKLQSAMESIISSCSLPYQTPPPPLSLLTSMSSSLTAFPSPPFSSSFHSHRPSIPTTLSTPPVHLPPFGFNSNPIYFRNPLMHGKSEDPMEQFMEVQKSETSKMEQLVRNIDKKLTDPNQCAICCRTLSCKSALQMHYRTHTGERPFRCKICGRAFTTKGNLKTHMGVHRAKPPVRMMHQCPVCHKQFTNALVLQQHIRMHTGEVSKQLPFHGNMMIVPSGMSYMPFGGYPFFPAGFPHIQRPPFAPLSNGAIQQRPPFFNAIKSGREEIPDSVDKKDENESSASNSAINGFSISALTGTGSDDREGDQEKREESDDCCSEDENAVEVANIENESISDDEDDISDEDGPSMPNDAPQGSPATSQSHFQMSTNFPDQPGMSDDYPEASAMEENSPFAGQPKRQDDEVDIPKSKYLMFDYPHHNMFSASLMALEEKVKEINSHDSNARGGISHPLEQMERIIQRTKVSPHSSHTWLGLDRRELSATPTALPESNNILKRIDDASVPSSEAHRTLFGSRGGGGGGGGGGGASSPGLDSMDAIPSGNSRFGMSNSSSDLQVNSSRTMDSMELSPRTFEATTGKPNTTCSICYKTFACKSALDIHYRSHTKERPFKCKLCDRAFSTKGNMKQHMMTHKINGDITSQMMFSSEGSCSSRSLSCPPAEDGPTPVKSDLPPVLQYSSRASSSDHSSAGSDHRADIGSVEAEEDDGEPEEEENAATNRSNTPETPRPKSGIDDGSPLSPISSSSSRRPNLRHMCHVCQKPFSSASALQIHMRTHTGDKPFKCTVCNKAFTTKGNLKVHMSTHMWNNGPSRRGRRMSVEGIACLAPPPPLPKCGDFFGMGQHRLPPPPHELYPFAYPGFAGSGFGTSKINEISVIQSLTNRMAHLSQAASSDVMSVHLPQLMKQQAFLLHPPPPLPSTNHKLENMMKFRDESTNSENNNHPEKPNTSGGRPLCGSSGELDLSVKKSMPQRSTPMHEMLPSPPWNWKTSCNLCSKVCSSPGTLELHMKSHPDWMIESNSPKPLMA